MNLHKGKTSLLGICVFVFSIFLFLETKNSFAQCAQVETYTSNPLPVNGAYPTSTTVTFCYSLNGFFQNGSNWVDGFIITFGSGWDQNSLTPVLAPNSCDGMGVWGFYQSVTSQGNGGTYGPGFFYDRYDPIFFTLDGDPGNDFGDFSVTGTCEWDLCFSLTVNPTCANSDLSVSVTAAGDGTVGGWISQNCPGIPFVMSTATCVAYCTGFSVNAIGTDPSCFNNDGSILTQTTAGTSPFSYAWNSTALTASSLSNVGAGTYIVTVTDTNSCIASDTITLTMPPAIWTNSVVTNATCLSYCNGSITLTSGGGQSPYSYLWSGGLPPINNPTNLCAGTYDVTVTDLNFCTTTSSLIVSEPAGMNINMTPTSTTCHGWCDGTMTASVSFGTPPYNLLWPNASTTNTVTGLCAGAFNVSVTDANGCTLLGNGSIGEPSAVIVTPHVHDVSCTNFSDGWIYITHQFAATPYSLIWNPTGLTTDTIKNLVAGIYNVTLTDFNGCTGNSSATVNQPAPLTLSSVTTPTSCPLSSDGIISVISLGGTPQNMYEWINPPGHVTPVVQNLPVGTYNVIVTDANGCTAAISDSIHSKLLFTVNTYGDTVIVNENSTTIGVTLTQPGNYSYIWTPESSVSYPFSSVTIVTPSYTTTYTVVVTENNSGCLNSDSVVVIVLPTSYIFIPNAFSPNDDGFNDFFQLIKGEIVTISDVQIHNRWGQIVYRQPELNWDGTNLDGKPCALGAYVYYVVYTIQGDPTIYRKQGNVTLVR
ncbi:MAG: gliding motility-associated C-terminal domain-containing protein [Bacteroidota bacterium]